MLATFVNTTLGSTSSVMWFRVSNRSAGISYPPISIDDIELTVTEKQKYLGLIFDCNLSWTHHVAYVCSKMLYYLYLLSTHRHVIDYNLIKLLLESLVLSHLSYCVTVWGPSLRSNLLQRLQRMQNRAVRLCCNLRKYDHVSAFYHKLNWLPLPCFIQFKSLCLMYRQYHHFKCIPLEPPIIFGRTSLYCTRTPVYFATIPMFRSNFPRFFRFKAIQWWNALPFSVTNYINSSFYEYVDALGRYCDSLH